MLRLILGISGTGKTGRVLAEMKVRAAARRRSILLVPEQFSSSAETMVYRSLGDAFSACAEVYSFTSFAELVLKTFGGSAVKTLTDAARAVAVRRAMDTLGDELQAYRRHRRSTGFCSMCADAIKELKTAGASPETLLDVARTAGEDGGKLHELGLIFAAYEALIAGSAMDPADRISAGWTRRFWRTKPFLSTISTALLHRNTACWKSWWRLRNALSRCAATAFRTTKRALACSVR